MGKEQNINITQTEAEALLEVLSFCKDRDFKDFEEWVGIELRDFNNRINETIDFEED